MFTFLFRVQKNDKFFIRVNGAIHAYQVDPHDFSALNPDLKADYVTLITCSARDNTARRILVRGHRVKYVPQQDTGEAGGLTPLGIWLLVIGGLSVGGSLIWLLWRHQRQCK